MSRPRKTSPVLWPSLMAPTRADIPNSVTILRAIPVAFSMSLLAPVVGSWKTISSATRPPRAYASWSRISLRVVEYLSSIGMTTLVVGRDLALLGRHDARALLRTGDDAVDGLVEGLVVDDLPVAASGEQGGLVEDDGAVGAGEAGRATGDGEQVDVGRHGLALGVDLEDPVATDHVGGVDGDLAVEAARTQQGRVEDVGAVGRRDEDDVGLDVEAVHLDEQLVERLLALVVPAAEAGAAVPADAVEHLDEVRAGDRVERHAGLAGDRAGQQRLAGARLAVEQHALGDLGAD